MEQSITMTKEHYEDTMLELSIKILSHQKALISLICDKYSTDEISADELYRDVMDDTNDYFQKILDDIYARRGYIDPKDILPS